MRCGHSAWVNEVIITPSGRTVHTLYYSARNPPSSILSRFLEGRSRAQPLMCTPCTLGEKLVYAVVCAWCGEIIFPGDSASLTYDDSYIPEVYSARAQAL